ncbi:hypothetical protein OROMI_009341 [Orobanche minor]
MCFCLWGKREVNQPDDKGCIYGLGSLGVALYAPVTSSSQRFFLSFRSSGFTSISNKVLSICIILGVISKHFQQGTHIGYQFRYSPPAISYEIEGSGAYYKGCQYEVYGEIEHLNPPDDKGCIYGLGSLGVALSAPATSSSQCLATNIFVAKHEICCSRFEERYKPCSG